MNRTKALAAAIAADGAAWHPRPDLQAFERAAPGPGDVPAAQTGRFLGIGRRAEADRPAPEAVYQHGAGNVFGIATGRVSALIAKEAEQNAISWLEGHGLRARRAHGGRQVMVIIEGADDPMAPLAHLQKLSSAPGVLSVSPEILLPKSAREPVS